MNSRSIKQKIRLFGNQPVEIKPLEGADSNFVFQVDNNYVYKWFPLKGQMYREIAGIFLFGSLSNFAAPLLIDKGDQFILSEFLSGSNTAFALLNENELTIEDIENMVTEFVADVFMNYQRNLASRMNLYPFLSFRGRLVVVTEELCSNTQLRQVVGSELADQLILSLNLLQKLIDPKRNSLLHRDLHLENLLVSKNGGLVVIDFEHCMDGPLELEFANSLFWHDNKSLAVDNIARQLRSKGITFDMSLAIQLVDFYFADQLVLALEREEFLKLDTLNNQYKSFQRIVDSNIF